MNPEPPQRRKLGWRVAHLPALLTASGTLLAGAVLVGWLAAGAAGAAGAATGVAVVTGSYLLSTLIIAWADAVHSSLVLPFGLLAYAAKFTVIGMVMAAVVARGWSGLVPMGFGVAAGVIGWTGVQIWWVVRHPPRLDYPTRQVSED